MLRVLENMFFSMPVSEEIMEKYNYLKENRYRRVGLKFIPITKTQYPAIGTSSKIQEFYKAKELEICFEKIYTDQLLLFDSIFNIIIEKSEAFIELIKNPVSLPYLPKNYDKSYLLNVNETKAKMMNSLKEYQQKIIIIGQDERGMKTKIGKTLYGKSLSEIGSQMFYKTELSQNKILGILDTLENNLA